MADNIILGFHGLLIISLSAIAAFYLLLTQSLKSSPRHFSGGLLSKYLFYIATKLG